MASTDAAGLSASKAGRSSAYQLAPTRCRKGAPHLVTCACYRQMPPQSSGSSMLMLPASAGQSQANRRGQTLISRGVHHPFCGKQDSEYGGPRWCMLPRRSSTASAAISPSSAAQHTLCQALHQRGAPAALDARHVVLPACAARLALSDRVCAYAIAPATPGLVHQQWLMQMTRTCAMPTVAMRARGRHWSRYRGRRGRRSRRGCCGCCS